MPYAIELRGYQQTLGPFRPTNILLTSPAVRFTALLVKTAAGKSTLIEYTSYAFMKPILAHRRDGSLSIIRVPRLPVNAGYMVWWHQHFMLVRECLVC